MDQDRDPQKDIELIQQIVSRISLLTHYPRPVHGYLLGPWNHSSVLPCVLSVFFPWLMKSLHSGWGLKFHV